MSTPIVMTFGKYQGEALEDIPASYLLWVLENMDYLQSDIKVWIEDNEDDLRAAAKDEQKFKEYRTRGFRK